MAVLSEDFGPVVVLAGGTGGAMLARGMLDAVGSENLSVIANTGDDIVLHGLHISPDADLITYWLADAIDEERGWGFGQETFANLEQLRAYRAPDTWFQLGDRDLATHIFRSDLLRGGSRPTEVAAAIAARLGVAARVLPMSDDAVATHVRAKDAWWHFQEYMIRLGAEPLPEACEFRGAEKARATDEVIETLRTAKAVVIGPSNPIASIGPILAVPGIRGALRDSPAPVVAVSPLVGGRSIKGPTEKFMACAGLELSHAGVARAYGGLIDGIVCDAETAKPRDIPLLETDTRLGDGDSRRRVSSEVLHFAAACN